MKACALVPLAVIGLALGGCATATRGSNTSFIVSTTPPGARVSTSVPVQGITQLSRREVARIKAGKVPMPHYTYRFCEPTPCGIKMPRKAEFVALISKQGYVPRTVSIKSLTRKEINAELAKKTAVAAGVTATAGAGLAAAVAAGTPAMTISAGALAGGMAIIAAPIVGVGLLIHGVDSASGANRDLWPNPIEARLFKADERPYGQIMSKAIAKTFEQERQRIILIPRKTAAQRQAEGELRKKADRKAASEARKARRNARRAQIADEHNDAAKSKTGDQP